MTACGCGTDCRAALHEANKHLTTQQMSLLGRRLMLQVCDQCGVTEPAGGFCSGCGHFPLPSEWLDQRTLVPDALKEARKAYLPKRIAHRGIDV